MCKKAILVIHGFTGSLADNEYLVNLLQKNRKFDVYAWTLSAHEKHIINKVKKEDWVNDVNRQIQTLIDYGYHSIYVVGHSMGGLLTTIIAPKYHQIKKIVLIAPAFDMLSVDQYKNDMKHLFEVIKDEDVTYKNVIIKALKTPASTLNEFRDLVNENKGVIRKVKTPCLLLHGNCDEVVPFKSSSYVYDNLKSKKKYFTVVRKGRHNLLKSSRKEEVSKYIEAYLRGGLKWKLTKKEYI